jgi:hypothetical protein
LDIMTSPGPEQYCREIEAYLCRKNDGHLIRIVGPAFEQVCGWADRGVPMKVAFKGIDRYFERYYAKGPRRRPVRVEFCEADVLDAFDEWRRAVGVASATPATGHSEGGDEGASGRRESLASHLDRTIARLTSLRAGEDRALDPVLDTVVRELDASRASAKGLRGDARRALVTRLGALDATLLDAARSQCDPQTLSQLEREAEDELVAFRERMTSDAYDQSKRACVDRLLREHLGLPVIAF